MTRLKHNAQSKSQITKFYREENIEEIIEKLAICNYLHGHEFRQFVDNGINPLHDMFASRYEYIPHKDLLVIYNEKLEEYKSEMEKAFFWQLKRLKTIELSGRNKYEAYDDTIKRIDDKRHKSYEYMIDNRILNDKISFCGNVILQQIYKNIYKREQEGKDQTEIKFHLKQCFGKTPNKGNQEVFFELFAEANTQVGLFKLPAEFNKFKELIYK